jgi:diguanylate cyclase (GGDEF)-like protein
MFKQGLQERIRENGAVLQTEDGFVQRIENDFMGVLRPIFFEGKRIGTLEVISDTELMWAKIREFVWVQMATSVLTLLLLLLLSWRLQSVFTRPIMSLIDTMREVAETKNYRTVLASEREDEFQDLYAGFNVMLAEIRERDELLSKLATSDALTGLANRRHAMESMQTMVTRAWRKGEPLGVIMLDVDFFKKVNDGYGHPVGDIVLKAVAQILQASAREYDLVARIGGEEFLVLCDNGTVDVAMALAERIRTSVEHTRIEYEAGKYINVTVSLGLYSALPSEADTANNGEALIRIADEALYHAKQGGRNRCVTANAQSKERVA